MTQRRGEENIGVELGEVGSEICLKYIADCRPLVMLKLGNLHNLTFFY